jgi:CheY-like chemotaxis protein
VLLVEDDHVDAFLVSELLREEAAPVQIRRAQSLHEGLDLLGAEPFDCVLLDLGLPDASGLDALERLREAAPHVAHLVLTGDRDGQCGIEVVRQIDDFFVSVVKLPNRR